MSRKDSNLPTRQDGQSEILLYQTEDGRIRLETRLQNETVWLTQEQMSTLFDKAKSTINEHIKNIFAEGELIPERVMRKFGISEFFHQADQFLQPGRHHFRRLPRQVPAWYSVPHLGHPAAPGVHRQGFRHGR